MKSLVLPLAPILAALLATPMNAQQLPLTEGAPQRLSRDALMRAVEVAPPGDITRALREPPAAFRALIDRSSPSVQETLSPALPEPMPTPFPDRIGPFRLPDPGPDAGMITGIPEARDKFQLPAVRILRPDRLLGLPDTLPPLLVLPPVTVAPSVDPQVPDLPRPRNALRERLVENAAIDLQANLTKGIALPDLSVRAAGDAGRPAPALVQLSRRLTEADIAQLARDGVHIESFLGGSIYIFSGDAAQVAASDLGGLVIAGRAMTGADKLRSSTVQLMQEAEAQSYFLALTTMADPEAVAGALRAQGIADATAAPNGVVATMTAEQVTGVAERPDILSIDAGPGGFMPLNDAVRAASRAEDAQRFRPDVTPPRFEGLSGHGVRIAIYDSSIDEANHDFCPFDGNIAVDRFFHRDTSDQVCADVVRGAPRGDPHGTHVAAIAAGSGLNSIRSVIDGALPFKMRGIAPAAFLSERRMWDQGITNLNEFYNALAEDAADVSNHSFVETLYDYGPQSAQIDAAIAGLASAPDDGTPIRPRPQVWAAGNNGAEAQWGNRAGYGSLLSQSKNAISVGSIDTNSGLVSRFSSLGPSFDGRLKPDVVAPGCRDSFASQIVGGVRSARAGFQGYIAGCGTSSAAPVVTGAIALMCEAAGARCQVALPSSFKAVLVATAQDLSAPAGLRVAFGYGPGPDFASGFGLIDIAAAARAMGDPDRWREAVLATNGEVVSLCFDVPEGAGALRLALAWDDPPAALSDLGLAALVNDLDLVLIDPDGQSHLPWAPVPEVTPPVGTTLALAARGRDYLNTVELAEAEAVLGTWRAEVRAATLPQGPQRLSLAGNVNFVPCGD